MCIVFSIMVSIDASVLHGFFDDKVSSFRDATAGAPAPQFTAAPIGCELRFFRPIMPADVIKVVQELPDKQCFLVLLPTWLLKANVSLLAPFLCRLFNWSLQHGTVPSSMQSAYVTLILKKADLD